LRETILINNSLPADGSVVLDGPYQGFQRVNIESIRPLQPISIDIRHFTAGDIRMMLEVGYTVGLAQIK